MIEYDGIELSWVGYATLRIEADGTVVYLDPGRYGVLDGYEGGDGQVVCVTHDHHYDTDGIRTVAGKDATVVLFEAINPHRIDRDVERPADLPYEVREVDEEADLAVGDAVVRTTAAYNEPDGPHVRADGDPYHPEGMGCGFLVTFEGTSVYWPGDTDVLDGHEHLDVDVFCPPIGGTYTMDRRAAADLAARMEPGLVVPIHYDTFEAIEADAGAFAADLEARGVDVALDE
jgi:L-ascorbate metabolism protein UlaG (beta-lactamase superfamily)